MQCALGCVTSETWVVGQKAEGYSTAITGLGVSRGEGRGGCVFPLSLAGARWPVLNVGEMRKKEPRWRNHDQTWESADDVAQRREMHSQARERP